MKRYILFLLSVSLLAVSCIENTLSYPRVKGEILAFEVQGQKSVTIDAQNRIVDIVLEETAREDSVKVIRCEYSEMATPDVELPEVLDLRDSVKVVLTTYPDQSYEWIIRASRPIERYVKCDGMVGDPIINPEERSVIAYFPDGYDLTNIKFKKIKLEPRTSKVDSTFGVTIINDVEVSTREEVILPMTLDCVLSRIFKVVYKDQTYEWRFTALHKVIELQVTSVNAWCYKADIRAEFKGEGSAHIEYKEVGSQDWIALTSTVDGTVVTASVDQLTEGTDYVARVINNGQISEEYQFTTETPEQLPNMSFDEWHQGDPGGYTWYPMPEGGGLTWGTANTGVNMVSAVNSTRPEDTFVVKKGGRAVRMESVYVFGKFAAGNVYTGEFLRAVLSPSPGAELNWGVPFTTRPYSLVGYYAYSPKTIDYASGKHADKLGQMDKAQILVFLTDWEEPFLVATSTETFVDLQNDPNIIALGMIETDVDTGGQYQEFECVLEYRNDRKPKYIVAVACSSLYGDYFTGGQGSVMYVDEWEFIYR